MNQAATATTTTMIITTNNKQQTTTVAAMKSQQQTANNNSSHKCNDNKGSSHNISVNFFTHSTPLSLYSLSSLRLSLSNRHIFRRIFSAICEDLAGRMLDQRAARRQLSGVPLSLSLSKNKQQRSRKGERKQQQLVQ